MKVYLAAQFARREEMAQKAEELADLNIKCTSSWLKKREGTESIDPGDLLAAGVTDPKQIRDASEQCCYLDLHDIDLADVFVCFTEDKSAGFLTGGRHVELGYALGHEMDCVVIGPLENIFYCHWRVQQFETWEKAKEYLAALNEYGSV